jgi:hypothetical protein
VPTTLQVGGAGSASTVGRMGEVVAWAFELAEEKLAGVLPSRWAHVHVDRSARLGSMPRSLS